MLAGCEGDGLQEGRIEGWWSVCGGGHLEANKELQGNVELFFRLVSHISIVLPSVYISLPLPYASPLLSLPLFSLPCLTDWFGKFVPVNERLIFVCLKNPHACCWAWKVVYLASHAVHKQNTLFSFQDVIITIFLVSGFYLLPWWGLY